MPFSRRLRRQAAGIVAFLLALAAPPVAAQQGLSITIVDADGGAGQSVALGSGQASMPPQPFDVGPVTVQQTFGAWTLHAGRSWCLLEGAGAETDMRVFAALDSAEEIGLIGFLPAQPGLPPQPDIRMRMRVDGVAVAEGAALARMTALPGMSAPVPAMVLFTYVDIPAVATFNTMEEGFAIAGARVLNRMRVDADPETVWRRFRAGAAMTLEHALPDGTSVQVEIPLTGSARAFREMQACVRGL